MHSFAEDIGLISFSRKHTHTPLSQKFIITCESLKINQPKALSLFNHLFSHVDHNSTAFYFETYFMRCLFWFGLIIIFFFFFIQLFAYIYRFESNSKV